MLRVTKFEFVINLTTAKALGISVPPGLLAIADEVVNRRAFITLLGGVAAWPLAARAQQPRRMRRIGVLTPFPADDAEGLARPVKTAETSSRRAPH